MQARPGGYETFGATTKTLGRLPFVKIDSTNGESISWERSHEETFFAGGRGSVEITEKNETELIKAGGV
jgi:hypothetical protein